MCAYPHPGAKSEDFEIKPSTARRSRSRSRSSSPAARSLKVREKGQIGASPIEPRTAKIIQEEIGLKIRNMIEKSVAEIDEYEARAKATVDVYRGLLEKERLRMRNPGYGNVAGERRVSFPSANASPATGIGGGGGGVPVKGILSNAHVQSPVDHDALRRMSVDENEGGISPAEKARRDQAREREARELADLELQTVMMMDEIVRRRSG